MELESRGKLYSHFVLFLFFFFLFVTYIKSSHQVLYNIVVNFHISLFYINIYYT